MGKYAQFAAEPGSWRRPAPVDRRFQLLKTFRIFLCGLVLGCGYFLGDNDLSEVSCAAMIAAGAVLPTYLWCRGKAGGMPIFPLYALTFVWTYALPLLSGHPQIVLYPVEDRLFASTVVAAFLLTGTLVWYHFTRSSPRPLPHCLAMSEHRGDRFFIAVQFLSLFFTMAVFGGWLHASDGVFAMVRGVVLGLSTLSVFVLAYRWGARQLSRELEFLTMTTFTLNGLANASSLLLVGSMTIFVLAVVAFALGRKTIPWVTITVVLFCFAALHIGKGDMRRHYWGQNEMLPIQPWQYPDVFVEWFGYSLARLTGEAGEGSGQSMLERASLMQLFLKVQASSPERVPYLMGATYAIIPELFVPRILNPDKVASHEGTYLLNIRYGLQNRRDTRSTTIGWGLLNEAYANFGVPGGVLLAVILGGCYGKIAHWSMQAPVLSLRALVALLFMSFSMQSEYSAGVYLAALFQSLVALWGVAFVFMKRQDATDALRLE